MLIKVTLSERDLHGYQNLHKTQPLFELFLKSPMGKINGGKMTGTIFLFDRYVLWVL